jgi:hypothetical protein
MVNPFPGLRPYEPEEDHLFFGREKETDDLVRRLRSHRFRRSSAHRAAEVLAGSLRLIPSLQSGFMVTAGSRWRVAICRPGEDPIGRLAEALDHPDVIGAPSDALAGTNRVLLEATFRRGALGLADAVRFARIPAHDNVLILVDQFEELFRFRRSRNVENSREEAVAFVKLLLEAARQTEVPIYVVLTMRSDFIGDCMDYPGLPEAVNESQYLVPRMTRDELRSAITGPVAVAGGRIAPRLVVRLLNEVGDDQDELPLLQHALMRAWDHWAAHRSGDEPIDVLNYEAIGTLRHALSQHAEEAYEKPGRGSQASGGRPLQGADGQFSDPRGSDGRPRSGPGRDLRALKRASPGSSRSSSSGALVPDAARHRAPASAVIVDVSHESLMRCWERLIVGRSKSGRRPHCVRLSREASWFDQGAAGLWGDPAQLALRWRHASRLPRRGRDDTTRRSTARCNSSLSEEERDRQRAERRQRRLRYLELAWGSAGVLLVMTSCSSTCSRARVRRKRAEDSLGIANRAVNETWRPRSRANSWPPSRRTHSCCGGSLERARPFYQQLVNTAPAARRS